MRRTRSLELRWAVRYAVVTAVVLALFGVVVDQLVERALRRDAELLLELELAELLEELGESTSETPQQLARMVAPELASARTDLRLSFQIFDPDGRLRYGRGVLHEASVPLPREAAASPGQRVLREVDLGGEYDYPFLVLAASAGEDGAVQVGMYSRVFVRSARRIRDGFLAAVPVGLLLAAGVGLFLARSSLRPVSQIVAAARRITSERLDENIPTTGSGDELDQIAEAFNDVLDRIRAAIAALRHFSADAAHQLRSPLTALRTRLEVTLETNDDLSDDQRGLLEGVLRDVGHMSQAVDAMLQLSRSEAGLDPGQRNDIDLEGLLRSVAEFFEPLAEQQGLALRCETQPARVSGDATWLRQLFVNLVENALAYTADGGRVEIRLERTPRQAVVEVRDTGRGIATGERERIFERFYRGDGAGAGLGLGLTLARVIALAHHGSIAVESEPGKGSRFTVRLPALPEPGAPPDDGGPATPAPGLRG